MCNGRGCAEHWANMVVEERRNQSKNSGLARTTFPCVKKATASPLQYHSVMTGYCEGVVPRSLACCQWEAHRRHILWHHLLAQMGFVFMMKIDVKFSFAQAAQLYLPTKTKFSNK